MQIILDSSTLLHAPAAMGHRITKRRSASQAHVSPHSGVIRLDGCVILYTIRGRVSFTVSLDEIAVIGDYTTDNGPLIDDWFYVFVLKNGADWTEVSMYADGMEGFHKNLALAVGTDLELGLANSTDFKSRVVWPSAIAGRPLFEFSPVVGTGFWERLRFMVVPAVSLKLSGDVLSVLSCFQSGA